MFNVGQNLPLNRWRQRSLNPRPYVRAIQSRVYARINAIACIALRERYAAAESKAKKLLCSSFLNKRYTRVSAADYCQHKFSVIASHSYHSWRSLCICTRNVRTRKVYADAQSIAFSKRDRRRTSKVFYGSSVDWLELNWMSDIWLGASERPL